MADTPNMRPVQGTERQKTEKESGVVDRLVPSGAALALMLGEVLADLALVDVALAKLSNRQAEDSVDMMELAKGDYARAAKASVALTLMKGAATAPVIGSTMTAVGAATITGGAVSGAGGGIAYKGLHPSTFEYGMNATTSGAMAVMKGGETAANVQYTNVQNSGKVREQVAKTDMEGSTHAMDTVNETSERVRETRRAALNTFETEARSSSLRYG